MSDYIIHDGTLMSLELYHHGVKGMKWGVRKKEIKSQYRNNLRSVKNAYKQGDISSIQFQNKKHQLSSNKKRSLEKLKYEKGGLKYDDETMRTVSKYGFGAAKRIQKKMNKTGMSRASAEKRQAVVDFTKGALIGIGAITVGAIAVGAGSIAGGSSGNSVDSLKGYKFVGYFD